MINYVLGLWANRWLAVGLYWLPLSMCAWGYLLRTSRNIQRDKMLRVDRTGYIPSETIGGLMGRALVTLVPIANLWAAMFDVGPEVFGKFFRWLGDVFDQPLVPDSPSFAARRKPDRRVSGDFGPGKYES